MLKFLYFYLLDKTTASLPASAPAPSPATPAATPRASPPPRRPGSPVRPTRNENRSWTSSTAINSTSAPTASTKITGTPLGKRTPAQTPARAQPCVLLMLRLCAAEPDARGGGGGGRGAVGAGRGGGCGYRCGWGKRHCIPAVPGRTCGHVWRGFAEVGLGASAGFSRQSCAQLRQASCEAASHHLAPPPSRCAETPRRISPQGPPMYLLCQLWPRQDSGWPSWWPYPRRYRDSAHLKSANRGC
jgi:hypothetical protein